MRRQSTLASLLCAVALVGATTSATFAGEITGNDKPTAGPDHANSICVFSGQNDMPDEVGPEGGRTQSFGQLVRKGVADPTAFNPGDACRGGSNTPGQS